MSHNLPRRATAFQVSSKQPNLALPRRLTEFCHMTKAALQILTVGHSTRSIEDFIALLKAHDVRRVVDVRTIPRSRHNPQFNHDALSQSLRAHGIQYTHMSTLGGLRHPRKDSPNTSWRNNSFRGYADHMQTDEFAAAVKDLIKFTGRERIVVMCAEAVPWRCHRSLIADALIVRSVAVEHIMSKTKRQPHELTAFARVSVDEITYPAQQTELKVR
jgi:uncharacterized protein (DUF488 family)